MAEDNKKEDQKNSEKLRYWKLARAAHKLKNRSSKTILRIHHLNRVDIYRSLSGIALSEMSKNGNFNATQELLRRDKIHDKNQARKKRYQEKLEAKKASKA